MTPRHAAEPEPPGHLTWHTEPEEVGMLRATLQDGVSSLAEGLNAGLHPGAQLYVSRHGRPVLEYACGESRPGTPLDHDSVMAWFSSCKPVTAMAVALLVERGALELDDPVVRYIPEFSNGKERCTLRHLLTHQGGFPSALEDRAELSWDEVIALICAAPLEWPPGSRAAYHHSSGWYVLGEIVRRVDGRPIERFVAEELLAPLGMADAYMGIPPAEQARLGERLAQVAIGRSERAPFVNQAFIDRYNSEREIARVSPGGGMRGPARALGRFYEMLLAKGQGPEGPLLQPLTVELFTACHRWGLPDQTLMNAQLAWGLGFGLHGNSDLPTAASRRVFCHSGMVSSVGMGDPERGLACIVITSGLLDPIGNARRLRAVTGAAVKACDSP